MAQLDSICRICLQQDLLLKTVQPKDETMTAIYDIIFKCASVQVCGLCEQELSRSYRFFSNLCSKASNERFQAYYKDGVVYIKSQNREVSSEFDSEEETFEDLDYSSSDNCSTDESKNDMDFGSVHSNIDEVNDITSKKNVKDGVNEVIKNFHVNTEDCNANGVVQQINEDIKIEHDLELVIKEPPVFNISGQSDDSSDVMQSVVVNLPKIVIPNLKCYPCGLCSKAFIENNARQRHVFENHNEGITVDSEIDTVNDLTLERNVDDNHDLELVKEEPPVSITSEKCKDSTDDIESAANDLPNIVIPKLKIYSNDLFEAFVQDYATQQYMLKDHREAITVASKINEVDDLTLKKNLDGRTVEVPLNLEKSQVKDENYDGYDGVLQFDKDETIDITDHELQFKKEEELSSSEENNDSFDVDVSENAASPVISFPKVVIRRIICYPCDLCGKPFVDDSARQQHERENHYEATAISDEKPSSSSTLVKRMKICQNKNWKTRRYTQCKFCNKAFSRSRKTMLKSHIKRQHSNKELFKCGVCNCKYASAGHLREHLRLHDNSTKMYTCDVCNTKFKLRTDFECHMKLKHSIKTHACNKCCRNFTSKDYLTEHRNSCTVGSKKSFKCEICKRIFSYFPNFREHIRNHDNPTLMYTCDICSKKFKIRKSFNYHMNSKHSIKPYACYKCCRNFTSKNYLTEHRHNCTVGSKKRLKCEICNRNFATLSYLREHIRHHDNPTLMYTCDVCGAKFKIRERFVYHMNAKHSIKPYACNNCCRNFTSKNYLTEHKYNCTLVSKRPLEKHSTGKKLYKCEICDRTFASSYYLMQHRRLHNNPTILYTCDVCGAKFSFWASFANHRKQKHSMKTYTCIKCCKNFSCKTYLKEHRKSCTPASNQLTISENAAIEKYH